METALFELLRSVSAMKAKQSFYVIFQSDQAYEMYHPDPTSELVPATPQHKAQLQAWLTTIELCYGDAKSLRDAVARAELLEPNAVFLLSDGDFSTFTRDRICATARPDYVLHTLGMTVRDEEDANNLIAIADAHGGTFRPVAVSPAAAEMASRRPIPKRPRGTSWGRGWASGENRQIGTMGESANPQTDTCVIHVAWKCRTWPPHEAGPIAGPVSLSAAGAPGTRCSPCR